jgi:ParB family transcriptional regulator, chromosome partitioning protein
MGRKNPFANILSGEAPAEGASPALDYAKKGATRSLLTSIGELSAQADRLLQGETIVELDPNLIEESFAKDRFSIDDDYGDAYEKVLDAVRQRGQDTPVLVRPHPTRAGHYMLVFGHLRRRAAVALGRPVRAVVKQMTDRDHVIAQGQENNGRANTSFIEKAMFAADIARRGFDQDNSTAIAALGVDRATLSKMLAVASLPEPLLRAIGRAKRAGRDRWYELKLLLDRPGQIEVAAELLKTPALRDLPSDERFDALLVRLASKQTRSAQRTKPESSSSWTTPDRLVAGHATSNGKNFTLALKAKGTDAQAFGTYLTAQLDRLYDEFRRAGTDQKDGD